MDFQINALTSRYIIDVAHNITIKLDNACQPSYLKHLWTQCSPSSAVLGLYYLFNKLSALFSRMGREKLIDREAKPEHKLSPL